jgi:hypothetical protein
MAARYSLRVTHVYRGLLIDNGLHIDPGYHGPIYIPVHNFIDQARTLKEDWRLLSMEFARTTPLPAGPLTGIVKEAALVGLHGTEGIDGHAGYKAILFNKRPEDLTRAHRTPKDFWNEFPGETHKSAMIGTEGRLKELREEVTGRLQKSVEGLQRVSYWVALGLLVGLLGIMIPWISGRYLDTERAYRDSAEKVQALSEEVQDLKAQLAGRPAGASAQQPAALPQKAR